MHGQFEIWRMTQEAEEELRKQREPHLQHRHLWRSQQPSTFRTLLHRLHRRPHIRTITIRVPLPVLAQSKNCRSCGEPGGS